MNAAILKDSLANADLVIGTPEYNKIRYAGSSTGSPVWLTKLVAQKTAKERQIGKSPYVRRADSHIIPRRQHSLEDDIWDCIAQSLHLKTKSFEYIPKTGKIYLYGQEAAAVNRQTGIFSFTLKNVDTGKSRFILRKLNIKLTSEKGKTYWNVSFGRNLLTRIIAKYDGLEGFRFHYRNIFPTMDVESHSSDSTKFTLKLGLRRDIYYQCGFEKNDMYAWLGVDVIDGYSETDIFGIYVDEKPLVADPKQYRLEFRGNQGSFVKPGISIRPYVNLNFGLA